MKLGAAYSRGKKRANLELKSQRVHRYDTQKPGIRDSSVVNNSDAMN